MKSEIKQMTSEKYSLRPRHSVRRKFKFDDDFKNEEFPTINYNYGRKNEVNRGKLSVKHRPPPLSKYRRKTANARERSRMKEINSAFETLRKAVPSYMPELVLAQGDGTNEKLTKITTLKLAMLYISGLTELLRKEKENEEERLCLLDESVKSLVNYHPTLFRDCGDTCTLAALNTTTYDIFESSNSVLNDCGSDGESFHSGDTLDSFIKEPMEVLVPDLDLNFPDNLIDTELS